MSDLNNEVYSREAYDAAEQKSQTAEGEKGRLEGMAWDEALRLNEEYDQLWAKKEEAEKAVADFRRGKLDSVGETREAGAKLERTRESEIATNVRLWKDLGLTEEEARKAIEDLPEKEGFDGYLVIKGGVKPSEIATKLKERFPFWSVYSKEEMDAFEMPRSSDEAYAIAFRYQQEPEGLGKDAKSAEEWEKTSDSFMNPVERMLLDIRWHAENGNHLDEKNVTFCPGSRARGGDVPRLCFDPYRGDGKVCLSSCHVDLRNPSLGVRRVVSKNLES